MTTFNRDDSIDLPELAAAPEVPDAGRKKLFLDANGKMQTIDAAGVLSPAGITWSFNTIDLVDGNMVDDTPLEIVVANYIPGATGASVLCCLAYMEEFNGVGRVLLQGNLAVSPDPLAYVVIGGVEANGSVTFPVFLAVRDGSVFVKRNSLSGGSAGVTLTPLFFA